ncbi:MAG: hypothetical protein ACXACG_00270 [Candidatus Thorarchaeota archaeon]|jgi:hypothetical protein
MMKTRWVHGLAAVIMFALCISVYTNNASAAMVWNEDFDNLTDWTTFAFEHWTNGPVIAGNFSVDGGVLTVLDDDVNYARHDSTINVGTWSFDLFVPDVPAGWAGVAFMSNGTRPIMFDTRMISVEATTVGVDRFIFWWLRGPNEGIGETCYTPETSILGWHHIDITRTSGGLFNVFFNDTFEYTTVTNDVTLSTYFECFADNATGAAFDNIVVSDTIDITPPTTTPSEPTPTPLPWDLIAIGGGVAVVVIVLAIVCVKRR